MIKDQLLLQTENKMKYKSAEKEEGVVETFRGQWVGVLFP